MDPTQLATVLDRLERLERENRRLNARLANRPARPRVATVRWLLLPVAALAVAMTGSRPDDAAKTLEASRFALKDPEGRERVVLGFDANGNPNISFKGPDRNDRLVLGLDQDGVAKIALKDEKAETRLSLQIGKDQSPSLVLHEASGQTRFVLAIHPNGTPLLALSTRDKSMLMLQAPTGGEPRISISEDGDHERVRLTIDGGGGGGGISLFSRKGETAAAMFETSGAAALVFGASRRGQKLRLGLTPQGTPQIVLNNEQGEPRLGMSVSNEGDAGVVVHDRAGKPAVTLLDIGLGICSKDGSPRLGLGIEGDGAYLGLSDANLKERFRLKLNADGKPEMVFMDGNERVRTRVGLSDGATPAIQLLDEHGKPRPEPPLPGVR